MKAYKLFAPYRLGRLQLKNRILFPPMNIRTQEGFGTRFSRGQEEFWAERARGGAGLIITGQIKIENKLDPYPRITVYPVMDSDTKIKEAARIADRVHVYDTKIFAQLNLGGGLQADAPIAEQPPVSASENPVLGHPEWTTRALTIEEIEYLIGCFADAAGRMVRAGFDGIYMHTSGYLLEQFLRAKTNRRTDAYGGSFENCMRIFRELLSATRAKIGPVAPIVCSMIIDEGAPVSAEEMEETRQILLAMQDAGIDGLDLRVGGYRNLPLSLPGAHFPDCVAAEAIKAVREGLHVPVLMHGKITSPEEAEEILESGLADLVGVGRPFIADPDWGVKMLKGRREEIRPCLYCMQCSQLLLEKKYVGCSVNPEFGYELYPKPTPALEKKRFVVVGGGPAGMEFARIAAKRGHEVHLIEREAQLGGRLKEAALPDYKFRIGECIAWYERELAHAKVDIRLNTEATPELLACFAPDAVIAAVGAKSVRPPIPGIERAKEALPVMRGEIPVGKRVIVIGGGLIGCELAYMLAKEGKRVEIVEMLDRALAAESIFVSPTMLKELDALGVKLTLHAAVTEIRADGLTYRDKDGALHELAAEDVILAAGMAADKTAAGVFAPYDTYWIGDGKQAGKMIKAVQEGYRLAMEL